MTQFTVVREQDSEPDTAMFSLRNLLQMLRRRAIPLGLTVAGVLVLVAAAYMLAPRTYEAIGTVALDRRLDELVQSQTDVKPLTTDSSSVDTEVQVIASPAVAAAVVDGLSLTNAPGFGVSEDAPDGTPPQRDRAIRVVQSGLEAARTGTSYAIAVKYAAEDPILAARVVNAAINAYTGGQRSSEAQRLSQEIGLLRDRINLVRGELLRTERSVAQYRARTGLIDLAANSDAANQAMQDLNTQLAQARADEAAARAKAGSRSSIVNVTSSPTINALREEQARLAARQAELKERYAEGYPQLVAINEQLASVNGALSAEQSRVQQGVAAEAGVASNRASSLRGSVNQQQSALMRANTASVQLGELQRNADAARTLYASLLDQYKQKLAAQGTERSKAYVVAYAAPPSNPASPNSAAYMLGGVLLALIAGGLVASTLENLEGGLLHQAMAERELGIPVLAAIPDIETVKDSPIKDPSPAMIADHLLEHPTSVFAESLRSIRSSLKLGQEGQSGKCLAVTSAVPDEGKTATSICLARACVMAGSRVLIVDCDLRHHSCSDILAPNAAVGLSEVLRGEARLDQAVVRDRASGIDVLPASVFDSPDVDILTSGEMRNLLHSVRHDYDVVILETPPVLPVAETRVLAAMADGTILLVRWRKTPVEVAKKALKLLNRAEAKVIGSVLTRVSLSWTSMGSLGDDVYYYQSYGPKAA
jgi:capsular exopolysaccharide synthesis family protein